MTRSFAGDRAWDLETLPLDPAIAHALAGVTTATLTTVLLKKGLRNVWMRGARPLRAGQPRLVGRAFTLRFVPAREDLATPASWAAPISTRAAIEAMPAGCIAVVDAMGVTDAGIFGDILCARMAKRGVAGAGHRRRGARPGRRAGHRAAGVVPGRGGAALGGRPDLRRLAAADRLRRRGRVPQRRGRGRRRRRGADPAALLDEVVAAAVEQERLEGWIMGQVEAGQAAAGPVPAERGESCGL